MGHALHLLLAERLASGLRRTAIRTCSRWARSYRVMGQPYPGPWSFDHHPWLIEPHDCTYEKMVTQKGAQLGWTELALNKTFYNIDIKGNSVLYILPAATPDARDFSSARFDPALEMSPHLKNLFDDAKNVHHKRSGNANLYIRGSRVKSQLKSVPVSLVVLDELDEMVQKHIPLARERMSGQVEKQEYQLSTPTVERVGINASYHSSTQDSFFFKCPSCSKLTNLIFPECLVLTADNFADPKIRDSHLICKECKAKLPQATKPIWLAGGEWVSRHPNRLVKGYHISQLYSMTTRPWELADSYLKGLTNATDEQEFFNSKLGLPHEVDGARVTENAIDACVHGYTKTPTAKPNTLITMGVDVGKVLHYEINQWYFDSKFPTIDISLMGTPKIIAEGSVREFEDLDRLMVDYHVTTAVVDRNPETRKALEFANRWYGRVYLCLYVTGMATSKQIRKHAEGTHTISVDRTSWMDLALGRFARKAIVIPRDLTQEYRRHVKTPVRVTKRDKSGNTVARYVTGHNDPDHLAHARTYSEIALPLARSLATSYNIPGVL